jgi:hypothetical protein
MRRHFVVELILKETTTAEGRHTPVNAEWRNAFLGLCTTHWSSCRLYKQQQQQEQQTP